jgi:glycine/D-amino acid oxidase-like deaminating enzyme
MTSSHQVNIVGGGIAGLIAAVELARAGVSVRLFEAAATLGGRARTKDADGFLLNQGPHALYIKGAFKRTLDRLGIAHSGGRALGGTRQAIFEERLHDLPVSTGTLMGTSLFGVRDKVQFARVFKAINDGATGEGSFACWLDAQKLRPRVRTSLEALGRLTGYANGSDVVSAAALLDQIRLGLKGTLYLDGGWSSLVEGLAKAAREAGADLHVGARVERVSGGRVVMADGAAWTGDATLLALGPAEGSALAADVVSLAEEAREARPSRVNALDLALSRMPEGAHDFAIGIDGPFYFSLHSKSAKLAPGDGAVVHVAKYLPAGEMPARDAIEELERVADLVMPGWRPLEVRRQELRGMVVANGLPRWDRKRASVQVKDAPGLFVAGDWVGDEGMIADAAAASAVEAAGAVGAWLKRGVAQAA